MPLRPMTAADAAYAAGLTARTPQAAAWSEADYASLLRQAAPARGFGFVVHCAGKPAGFLVGRIVADEAEILNVAVEPEARRRGAGRELVRAAIACAGSAGARRIFLEVRAGNQAARRLYEGEGFLLRARRQAYYREPAEDGLVLERRAGEPAP